MRDHVYNPHDPIRTAKVETIPCEVRGRKGDGPGAKVLIRFQRNSLEGIRTLWVNAAKVRAARPGEILTVPK